MNRTADAARLPVGRRRGRLRAMRLRGLTLLLAPLAVVAASAAGAALGADTPATRPAAASATTSDTTATPQPAVVGFVPYLRLQGTDSPETVYAPPSVEGANEGFNGGALSLSLTGRYVTDYVYRGLELVEPQTHEDSINVQVDALLKLDLGKLPDPFVRVFTNTAEGDNLSNFQVIRPSVGLEWQTDAFTLAVGQQSFTYPDRSDLDTSEVFAELNINDGYLAGGDDPIVGPYVFAAYDYDTYTGTYVEAGLRRTFKVNDTNLDLMLEAHVAYVDHYADLYGIGPAGTRAGSGFEHYQLSLTAHYDLNTLLNISRRYGQFGVEGYLNYTDGIDDKLAATTQIWGGAGITFRY